MADILRIIAIIVSLVLTAVFYRESPWAALGFVGSMLTVGAAGWWEERREKK